MRPNLLQRLIDRHAQREQARLARRLRTIARANGPHLEVDGRELLAFASNDYLGLAGHPAIRVALAQCAAREGVGATGAHRRGGHRRAHPRLGGALAEWTHRPRALLFSTGYMANLGIVTALLGDGELCVQDKLNHASLIDAARLAGAELKRYVHGDVDSAQRQLASRADSPALLASDGVFSMDGDVAPLRELAALCRSEGATFMVDDAHGLGVVGPEGRGSVALAGLGHADVPVLMGTLGKALGVAGAFVAGEAALVEGLVQFARTYVYTTAMPAALAAAALAAVEVARNEGWRRDKLALLVAHFRRGAAERGIPLADSRTPIQPVLVGDSAVALHASLELERSGIWVPAIRPPTVPDGAARLRVTLSAAHREADVELLLDALARAIGKAATLQPTPEELARTPRKRPTALGRRERRPR
jgi:8-amino-7-oxononanoate synthase